MCNEELTEDQEKFLKNYIDKSVEKFVELVIKVKDPACKYSPYLRKDMEFMVDALLHAKETLDRG